MELNKIHNADSYEFIKKIPDKSIDCIYTDVPYLYDTGGSSYSELGERIRVVQKEELKDIVSDFDHSILYDFVRVMKKINCFIWCSKLQILDLMKFFY